MLNELYSPLQYGLFSLIHVHVNSDFYVVAGLVGLIVNILRAVTFFCSYVFVLQLKVTDKLGYT